MSEPEVETDVESAASDLPVRELPRTAKGKRSRQAIIDSARKCFGDSGYGNTTVQDIASGAGLSLGGFYRYFDSRREVLLAVLAEFFNTLYHGVRAPYSDEDPSDSVRQTTVLYLGAYRENADLYRMTYETFLTDADVSRLWDQAREMFYARIARGLERGQERGVVRGDIDPEAAAALLGGMTEHYAFLAYVAQSPLAAFSTEQIADEIGTLWTRSISAQASDERTTNRTQRMTDKSVKGTEHA